MKSFSLLFVMFLVLLLSCNDKSSSPTAVKKLDTLTGTIWKLEKYKDYYGNWIIVKDSNQAPFILDFVKDTVLRGFSGCNEFYASYSILKDSISINCGMTTDVGCPLTGLFFYSIDGKRFFSANENELILKTDFPEYTAYHECAEMYFIRNTGKPKFHSNEDYEIDLNNDNIIDFKFNYSIFTDSIFNNEKNLLSLQALNNNVINSNFKYLNDIIDPNLYFFNQIKMEISACRKYFFGWYDYWFYTYTQNYIPVKVKLSDGYHYGWICYSVSRETGDLTVHDYALSKSAETATIAGQK